jgi:hypothetical protein
MNRALHQMTDDEREVIVEHDKVLLARVLKAMNEPDHFESEPEPTGAAAAYVLLGARATVAFVGGWLFAAWVL